MSTWPQTVSDLSLSPRATLFDTINTSRDHKAVKSGTWVCVAT